MHLKCCDAHTASWTCSTVEARSKRYRASRTCLSVFLRVIARRTSSHFCHYINATCIYFWSYVYAFFDVLLAGSSGRLRCSDFGAPLIVSLLPHTQQQFSKTSGVPSEPTRLALPATRHTCLYKCRGYTLAEYSSASCRLRRVLFLHALALRTAENNTMVRLCRKRR
jgi:hypothetical protein